VSDTNWQSPFTHLSREHSLLSLQLASLSKLAHWPFQHLNAHVWPNVNQQSLSFVHATLLGVAGVALPRATNNTRKINAIDGGATTNDSNISQTHALRTEIMNVGEFKFVLAMMLIQ
jgi:hypothetical protein